MVRTSCLASARDTDESAAVGQRVRNAEMPAATRLSRHEAAWYKWFPGDGCCHSFTNNPLVIVSGNLAYFHKNPVPPGASTKHDGRCRQCGSRKRQATRNAPLQCPDELVLRGQQLWLHALPEGCWRLKTNSSMDGYCGLAQRASPTPADQAVERHLPRCNTWLTARLPGWAVEKLSTVGSDATVALLGRQTW